MPATILVRRVSARRSLILHAGVDLKTIQKNVGYASSQKTMEIYGETFDESQVESVSRFHLVLEEAERYRPDGEDEVYG